MTFPTSVKSIASCACECEDTATLLGACLFYKTMKLYQFSKISARCFPNMTDLNNPWIFPKDVAVVVNVSQRFDAAIADELVKRGAEYYHFPLDEEVDDIGLENIVKAVDVLLRSDAQDKRMVVHCDYGQHRSRLVVEAFHYAKFGEHFMDGYKGYDNHLIYNCCTEHLPSIEKVEGVLSTLLGTCQL